MKKITTSEFIKKAKTLLGNKYTYGEVQSSLSKNASTSEFIKKATALFGNKYTYREILNGGK